MHKESPSFTGRPSACWIVNVVGFFWHGPVAEPCIPNTKKNIQAAQSEHNSKVDRISESLGLRRSSSSAIAVGAPGVVSEDSIDDVGGSDDGEGPRDDTRDL